MPLDFVTPHVALNESSKFLAGKDFKGNIFSEKGYQHFEETHLPTQIASYLKNILDVTQSGSHRSLIDKHVNLVRTNYLFISTLCQLLDVLVWFKIYVNSEPKTQNWKKLELGVEAITNAPISLISGKVVELNTIKGFAFFKPDSGENSTFIPPHLVESHKLRNELPIFVEIEEYIENRSGETKTRVKRIKAC